MQRPRRLTIWTCQPSKGRSKGTPHKENRYQQSQQCTCRCQCQRDGCHVLFSHAWKRERVAVQEQTKIAPLIRTNLAPTSENNRYTEAAHRVVDLPIMKFCECAQHWCVRMEKRPEGSALSAFSFSIVATAIRARFSSWGVLHTLSAIGDSSNARRMAALVVSSNLRLVSTERAWCIPSAIVTHGREQTRWSRRR